VALTVFTVLAILAPVAMAAPEWVHGLTITKPLATSPAFVMPDHEFDVEYTLAIVGLQVDDVKVRARLLDAYKNVIWEGSDYYNLSDLVTGNNDLTISVYVPASADNGWYSVQVCAMDKDKDGEWFCDEVVNAVLVDDTPPWVKLIRPADGAWVSGQNYLLVGTAKDDWDFNGKDIVKVWFQYCEAGVWRAPEGWCGPQDTDWVWIADGVPTPGIPHQYEARWDTSQVPDDMGWVRICATNLVGLTACDWNQIFVVNRYTVNLQPGWNLISTPLVLYNPDIENVLLHLIDKNIVKQVMTYNRPAGTWSKWTAPAGAPGDTLATIEDGKGYWIEMAAKDELTFVGTWSDGEMMPPTYPVYPDWNLIGYTHWGTPPLDDWWHSWWPMWPDKTVLDYLGRPVHDTTEALWRYDAKLNVWIAMYGWDDMVKGSGYWLAVSEAGTINP
jgi:hypothetical protein